MKKQLIIIHLGLVAATSSFASIPMLPKSFSHKLTKPGASLQKKAHAADEYANFSGHWVGKCDSDPEEKEVMDVIQDANSSLITINNQEMAIDALTAWNTTQDLESSTGSVHLRWNENGQQLLGTITGHYKYTPMSQGDLMNFVGTLNWSLNDHKLVSDYTFSTFIDGVSAETGADHCVFEKSEAGN